MNRPPRRARPTPPAVALPARPHRARGRRRRAPRGAARRRGAADALAREIALVDAARRDLAAAPGRALAAAERTAAPSPTASSPPSASSSRSRRCAGWHRIDDARQRAPGPRRRAIRRARTPRAPPALLQPAAAAKRMRTREPQRSPAFARRSCGLALAGSARREPIATSAAGNDAVSRSPTSTPPSPAPRPVRRRRRQRERARRRIVYPLDGAMHAINIGDITFQWRRGDAREPRVPDPARGRRRALRVLRPLHGGDLPLRAPCARLARDRATRTPGAALQATIEGTDGAGGPVFRSPAIAVRFSPEPVTGGLYYWTATSTGRHDVPATVRGLAGLAVHRPVVAHQPADLRGLPQRQPRRHDDLVLVDGRSRFAGRFPRDGADHRARRAAHSPDTASPARPQGRRHASPRSNTDGRRVPGDDLRSHPGVRHRDGKPSTSATPTRCCRPASWSPTPSGRRRPARRVHPVLGRDHPTARHARDGQPPRGRRDRHPGAGRRRRAARPACAASWSPAPATGCPLLSELVARRHWLVMAAAPRGTSAYTATTARLRLASADVDSQQCPGADLLRPGARLARDVGLVDLAEAEPVLAGERSAAVRHLQLEDRLRLRADQQRAERRVHRAQLWMAAIDLRGVGRRRSVAAAVLAPVPGHHRDQPPAVLDGPGRLHATASTPAAATTRSARAARARSWWSKVAPAMTEALDGSGPTIISMRP